MVALSANICLQIKAEYEQFKGTKLFQIILLLQIYKKKNQKARSGGETTDSEG